MNKKIKTFNKTADKNSDVSKNSEDNEFCELVLKAEQEIKDGKVLQGDLDDLINKNHEY